MNEMLNELLIPLEKVDLSIIESAYKSIGTKSDVVEIEDKKYIPYGYFYGIIEELICKVDQLEEKIEDLETELYDL